MNTNTKSRFAPIYGVPFDEDGNICEEDAGVSMANILDTNRGIIIEWWARDHSVEAAMIVDEEGENGPGFPRIFMLEFSQPNITSNSVRGFSIGGLRSIGMRMAGLVPFVNDTLMSARA